MYYLFCSSTRNRNVTVESNLKFGVTFFSGAIQNIFSDKNSEVKTKFLKIKEKEVGQLFGIKGCKINEITKTHKVFIDAQSTIDSFRIIDIDGTVKNIFKAATEIIKIVGFENCIILEEVIIMAAEKFNKIRRDTEETRFDAESKPPEDNKMKSDSINNILKEINDSDNLMINIMIINTTYSISTELLSQIFSNMKKQ